MGRWDKKERELLDYQTEQDEKKTDTLVRQDGIDIDGNGMIDAGESQSLKENKAYEAKHHLGR